MDKHYLGHRKRLKERLARSSQSLADYEVLELLLGYALPRRDTKELAKALLARCGSLRGLFHAPLEDLEDVPGMSPSVNVLLSVWREFWSRVLEGLIQERESFSHPRIVADFAIARLGR